MGPLLFSILTLISRGWGGGDNRDGGLITKSDRQRGGGGGLMYGSNAFIAVVTIQPRPQGLLGIQNGGRAAEKTLGSRLVTITGATLDGLNVNERLSIPIDEMTFSINFLFAAVKTGPQSTLYE